MTAYIIEIQKSKLAEIWFNVFDQSGQIAEVELVHIIIM